LILKSEDYWFNLGDGVNVKEGKEKERETRNLLVPDSKSAVNLYVEVRK